MINKKLHQNGIDSNQPTIGSNSDQTNSREHQPKKEKRESKRVEWLGTIVIPSVLTFATLFMGWVQFKIQDKQVKKSIIKEYIDNISSLKFDKNLDLDESKTELAIKALESEKSKAESYLKSITLQERLSVLAAVNKEEDSLLAANNAKLIGRAQTLAALRRLEDDGKSKGFVILFLHDSKLITLSKRDKENQLVISKNASIINLSGADLKNVKLENQYLWRVNLKRAILKQANFRSAILKEADLSYTDLDSADFSYADLRSANLTGANLTNVNLTRACYNDNTKIDFNSLKPNTRANMRKVSFQEDTSGSFECQR